MRYFGHILALIGFGTGLWAAFKWYKASGIEPDFRPGALGTEKDYQRPGFGIPRYTGPASQEQREANWQAEVNTVFLLVMTHSVPNR